MLAVCLDVSDFLRRRKRSIAISITHSYLKSVLDSDFWFNESKCHCTQSLKFLSEIFTCWKVNTTLRCQSRLHTASKTCVHNTIGIHIKHFERCFDSSEPPYKQTAKSRMAVVKFIHFVSHHKAP